MMDVNALELNEEQKEIILKLFNSIREVVEKIYDKIKQLFNCLKKNFRIYISNLELRKRYKFLKSIGIKNYVPFFKRDIFRCRNNC